jgi:hypothetical protein
MAVRTVEHLSIRLLDGSGNALALPAGPGNLALPDLEADDREVHATYNGHLYHEAVYGRQKQQEFTVQVYHDGPYSHATSQTIKDFIDGTGSYASGSATVDPGSVVRMLDVEITFTYSGASVVTTLNTARIKHSYTASLEGSTIDLSGTYFQGRS